MGFDLDRFVSVVEPDLLCKLCEKVLEEPLSTPCGHVFCAPCVLQWLSTSNSCPIRCQKMSPKDLNHVLPLKNLILKLEMKCDHHERGCHTLVKLQHLEEHLKMCDFSPVRCRNEGCDAVLRLRDVSSHMLEECDHRPQDFCQDGCGLMLSSKHKSHHQCLKALKTHSGFLQRKLLELERERKRQWLRERILVSKLSALHCELHKTPLRFLKKVNEYKSKIDMMSNRCVHSNKGEDTVTLNVTLHRVSGSLGFNIIGGCSCEDHEGDSSNGIYVSKIVKYGPAEKSGLHVHDRIIEVNGSNLSQATHDQAVETFQTAKEPIEIQIQRRTSYNTRETVQSVDRSTQTNITLKYLKHIEAILKLSSPSLPLSMAVLDTFLSPTDCHVVRCDLPSQSDFTVGTEEDIESQRFEVTLQRKISQDKLGLTLSYKTRDEKTVTFVSEIDPDGIASKDGRIQNGDQIIQIKGMDIQSHEEAVRLLKEEEGKNVTLLVSRLQNQGDCLPKNGNRFIEDLHMDIPEYRHRRVKEFAARMPKESRHKDDRGTTDTATIQSNLHEKDSGLGRTDDSTRNDESSEQDILGDDMTSVCDTLPGNHKKLNYSQETTVGRDAHQGSNSSVVDLPVMKCERYNELLEPNSVTNESKDLEYRGDKETLDSDELIVQMLNEELLNIELECLRIIKSHGLQTGGCEKTSNDSGPKYLTGADEVQEHKQVVSESSSAYNTGESGWSIPPPDEHFSDSTKDNGVSSPAHGHNSSKTCPKHPLSPIQESIHGNPEVMNVGKTKTSGKNSEKSQSLYIPAHAQRYQSYMNLIQQKSSVEYVQGQVSSASLCKNPTRPKIEWKIKIRSDGTRYIAKRSTRDQLLKQRALRIREERRSVTTDEDAVSELKLGRYWNKEERRQHIAHAKEQRLKGEHIKQGQIELGGTTDDKAAPDIIQLSHKKMTRRRNKRILDNWMTIQELLTHGTKSTDGKRQYHSFLSVTTV